MLYNTRSFEGFKIVWPRHGIIPRLFCMFKTYWDTAKIVLDRDQSLCLVCYDKLEGRLRFADNWSSIEHGRNADQHIEIGVVIPGGSLSKKKVKKMARLVLNQLDDCPRHQTRTKC